MCCPENCVYNDRDFNDDDVEQQQQTDNNNYHRSMALGY